MGSYSGGELSENVINEVYQRITEQTGIPQGYFTMDNNMYNEYIDTLNSGVHQMGRDPQLEDNSEPMPESETEQ